MALQEEMEQQGNILFRYRSWLPLFILGAGLAVYLLEVWKGNIDYSSDITKVYQIAGLAVAFLGLLVRVYTVGHTPKNTSGRNTEKGQVAEQLNSTGIYSMVRHPLYVGNFLMWLGIGILTQNTWFIIAFIFMYWVYYERIMYAEEQFLRRKFGEVYTNWAEGTPAFILSFKNFKSPKYTFSWKKVIKKEKNGVFAVFLIIWILRESGQFLLEQKVSVEQDFWFWAMAISGILYFILKTIKKRSSLLNEKGR